MSQSDGGRCCSPGTPSTAPLSWRDSEAARDAQETVAGFAQGAHLIDLVPDSAFEFPLSARVQRTCLLGWESEPAPHPWEADLRMAAVPEVQVLPRALGFLRQVTMTHVPPNRALSLLASTLWIPVHRQSSTSLFNHSGLA